MGRNFIYKVICLALVSATALMLMTGCESTKNVLEMSVVAADASELEELDKYINLETLDLSGSECYDEIMQYVSDHPQVEVKYDVQIGSARFAQDTKELSFNDGEYDYDQLLQRIAYLPDLTAISLPQTSLNSEELLELQVAYPDVAFDYTVNVLGNEVSKDTTSLDLSAMAPEQVDEVIATIEKLSNLTQIQLNDADGKSLLAPSDVGKLMESVPGVSVNYSFDLFGKTITTADERVEYVMTEIGNEGIPQIRQALDILPNCTYFKLDRCGIDTEEMVKLRDDYPNVKVVWRVYFGPCNALTDVEMIHCTKGLVNEQVQDLKYCTDVKYLDLGHNQRVSDISFIEYMPKLIIVILADSTMPSLEPFRNCPDLERIELVDCVNLTDISPLADCKKLKGINISCAFGIKDLTPLYGLENLERLYLGAHALTNEQIEEVREALPNCWVTRWAIKHGTISGNYAIGWRLDRDGTKSDWYLEVRKIFRYDEGYSNYND